jgi:RimJ/RimL family protein N-acetyltransferase
MNTNLPKIKLRALTESDMEITCRWHNSEDIKLNYAGHPFPVNIEMEKKWYEKILHSNFPTTIFGIEAADTSELVGLVMLKDINMINGNAEFSVYIGDEHNRNKGYASEATLGTVDFAFKKMGLHRVWLRVLADNTAAIKLYEKAGFVKEGILKESVFKEGSYRDEIIFAIVNGK